MCFDNKNGDLTFVEKCCSRVIQFTNICGDETFTFPLILVKGFVSIPNNEINNSPDLVIHRLRNSKPIEKFSYRLRCNKFSVLLSLEVGENKFSFSVSPYAVYRTYYYESNGSNFSVLPLFIVCRDGNESIDTHDVEPNLCSKIALGCQLIQTLIAESLFLCGYKRRTFFLENDRNANNSCVVFKSNLHVNTMSEMSAEALWEYFGREIMTSEYGSTKRKFIAFVSHNKGKCTKQLAIGGGGLALCDVQFLKTWPTSLDSVRTCFSFNDVDNDLNCRYKQFSCFSASLGAVCHELCHTFDLGHSVGGIMGKDYDRVSSIFLVPDQESLVSMTPKYVTYDTSGKDSLVVSAGTTRRTLNITYSVNNNPTDVVAEKSVELGDRFMKNVYSDQNFWTNGCASLLAHHRWITGNELPSNEIPFMNSNERMLQYDYVRGIITSLHSMVVVQLRLQCGYISKSWEFSAKRNKTFFLVPLYEARRASLIIVEDVRGNLFKKNLENFH